MRTRTHLTTPVGSEPDTPGHRADAESYSPALALPHEPHVPGRWRRVGVIFVVLLVLAAFAGGMWRVWRQGEDIDPTLDVPLETDDTFDPTLDVELPDEGDDG